MAIEDTRPDSRFGLTHHAMVNNPCRNFLHGVLVHFHPVKKCRKMIARSLAVVFYGVGLGRAHFYPMLQQGDF